ncbi:MAG TPA: hypothetical protein VJK51_02910 [Candidatus Nanoarchaeia archaeon]|nr:hypothetical protein [Candidatus Nanoarchaeia archaeon]
MNRQQQVFLTMGVLIVLIIGMYVFSDWFSKVTGYFTGADEKIKLADCLKEKGAELYTGVCADCERQQRIFGEEGYKRLVVIDCSSGCTNLRSLPAWYIDGKFEYGFKSLKDLGELSGCVEG